MVHVQGDLVRWGVVIAAGGTAPTDLAMEIGTPHKALARFRGRTSLAWTLDAVRDYRTAVVGPEVIQAEVTHGRWVMERTNAIENCEAGIDVLDDVDAILMLPADSPLITAGDLRFFIEAVDRCELAGAWGAVGLASYDAFRIEFPDAPATPTRLAEGRVLAGALYAASHEGFALGRDLAAGVRHSRKEVAKIALKFGLLNLIRLKAGWLRLHNIERAMLRATGVHARAIVGCHPNTVMDFDTVDEYRAVRACFSAAPAGDRSDH